MLDQLTIGSIGSYDTYDASVASRTIGTPAKKEIKETVPFSNVTYDFSAINGELYWEERELEYVFEITANTPAELESKKTAFASWVMNVMNENIYDPFIANHHFVGTYKEMEFEDDESVEKSTATVIFSAYPFKIANEEKTLTVDVDFEEATVISVNNNSAHKIDASAEVIGSMTILKNNTNYIFEKSGAYEPAFSLSPGENILTISTTSVLCELGKAATGASLFSAFYETHFDATTKTYKAYEVDHVDEQTGEVILGRCVDDIFVGVTEPTELANLASNCVFYGHSKWNYEYKIEQLTSAGENSSGVMLAYHTDYRVVPKTVSITYREEVF